MQTSQAHSVGCECDEYGVRPCYFKFARVLYGKLFRGAGGYRCRSHLTHDTLDLRTALRLYTVEAQEHRRACTPAL